MVAREPRGMKAVRKGANLDTDGRHLSMLRLVAVSEAEPSDHLDAQGTLLVRRLSAPSIHPHVTPTTESLTSPSLESPIDKKPTSMSPPIELFLTTIVSSPALRQRQGDAVHDPSAPSANHTYV